MTNNQHWQVPEALRLAHIFDNPLPPEWPDMVAAAAELRRQHTRIAELEAQIEALSGVQALSAAPVGFVPVAAFDRLHAHAESLAARLLAASPTPPAEQQATKETSGGLHVWRDISTAPKDGSRFVAIGYNYGLYSEGRHICVAQWFRGFWMETSDWNEASELKHLTHWLPLPSPPDNAAELNDLDVSVSPQQAATKAAPGEPFQHRVQPWLLQCFGAEIAADTVERNHRFLEEALELVQSTGCTQSEAHQLVDYVFGRPVGEPAQEVGGVMVTLAALCLANGLDMHNAGEIELARIWTKVEAIRAKQAAKPKPAPLSRDQIREVFMAHGFTIKEGQTDLKQYVYDAAHALLGTKPAPLSDDVVRGAAFEAVRKKLCALPRFSFFSDGYGAIRRVPDKSGSWIAFDAAHALFDPVAVDAALAAQGGK